MLSTSFALALLSTSGFLVVYNKMGRRVRKLIEKHSLLTDIVALVAIYWLFGGTLTALFAGAMCGLMISGMLHIVNNKERYLYFWDMKDAIKRKFSEMNNFLVSYGQQYAEHKAALEPK